MLFKNFLWLLCNAKFLHTTTCECSKCSQTNRDYCCALQPPNCCAAKTGSCPNIISEIPPEGITATICNGDDWCLGILKCCPILQRSTGFIFKICTLPYLSPNIAINNTTTTALQNNSTSPAITTMLASTPITTEPSEPPTTTVTTTERTEPSTTTVTTEPTERPTTQTTETTSTEGNQTRKRRDRNLDLLTQLHKTMSTLKKELATLLF